MTFVATDPAGGQGENTWFTPQSIIQALGPFDMDVCTVSWRPFNTARLHIEHDKGHCSLRADWHGFVWMNPPYGKEIEPFIKKFKEHRSGIALVFARMGASWMQDWIRNGGGVYLLRKRIRFINKDNMKSSGNAGTDSCLLFLGDKARVRIEASGLEGVFIK